ARTLPGELLRSVDSADAMCHFDELGQLRKAGFERDRVASEIAGPATTVPPLVRRSDRVLDPLRETQLTGECTRQPRVTLDHAVDLFVAVEEKLQADPESMHGLVSRAEQAHPVDD